MASLPFVASVGWICLSSFGYGWNIAGLNNLEKAMTCDAADTSTGWILTPCVHMTEDQFGFVTAAYTIGGLLGSLYAGTLADRYGRKQATITSATYLATGSAIFALGGTFLFLVLGRLILGAGCGIATVLVPIYLNEISPQDFKGRVGIMNQLAICTGILSVLGISIPFSHKTSWRTIPAIGLTVALLQVLTAPIMPESPLWLSRKAHAQPQDPSSEDSGLLSGVDSASSDAVQESLPHHTHDSMNITSLLSTTDPAVKEGMRVVIVTQIALVCFPSSLLICSQCPLRRQQISGINAVLYFSTSILGAVFPTSAQSISVAIAFSNWALTFAPALLIDRLGRRKLLLISSSACGVSHLLLAFGLLTSSGFLSTISTLAFVGAFSIGLGAIPFLIIPEVVPSYASAAAGSFGLALNWTANFLVGASFKPINKLMTGRFGEGSVFFVFAIFSAIMTLLISRLYKAQT